ncbi:MAG: hypothetical protein HC914_17265 [Chloroflexaceae bacterium]|nr:hypothetical protein [Chloroflexaceae bacterium]
MFVNISSLSSTINIVYTSRSATPNRQPTSATTYGYDALGRLETVSTDSTTRATYTYDSAGRPHTLTRENSATTTHTDDQVGRLATLTTAVDGSPVLALTYTTDRVGNRTQVAATTPSGTRVHHPHLRRAQSAGQRGGRGYPVQV